MGDVKYKLLKDYGGNWDGAQVFYPEGYVIDGELGAHVAEIHPDWVEALPVKPPLADGPPKTTQKRRAGTRSK